MVEKLEVLCNLKVTHGPVSRARDGGAAIPCERDARLT